MNRQAFGNESELRNATATQQHYNNLSRTVPNVLTEPLNVSTDGRYDQLRHRDSVGHQMDLTTVNYSSNERGTTGSRQNGFAPSNSNGLSANGHSNVSGRHSEGPSSSGISDERQIYRSSVLTGGNGNGQGDVTYPSNSYASTGGNVVGKGKPTKLRENQRHALEAIKNSLIPWDRERESVPPCEPVVMEPTPLSSQQECSPAQMLKNLVELGFDKDKAWQALTATRFQSINALRILIESHQNTQLRDGGKTLVTRKPSFENDSCSSRSESPMPSKMGISSVQVGVNGQTYGVVNGLGVNSLLMPSTTVSVGYGQQQQQTPSPGYHSTVSQMQQTPAAISPSGMGGNYNFLPDQNVKRTHMNISLSNNPPSGNMPLSYLQEFTNSSRNSVASSTSSQLSANSGGSDGNGNQSNPAWRGFPNQNVSAASMQSGSPGVTFARVIGTPNQLPPASVAWSKNVERPKLQEAVAPNVITVTTSAPNGQTAVITMTRPGTLLGSGRTDRPNEPLQQRGQMRVMSARLDPTNGSSVCIKVQPTTSNEAGKQSHMEYELTASSNNGQVFSLSAQSSLPVQRAGTSLTNGTPIQLSTNAWQLPEIGVRHGDNYRNLADRNNPFSHPPAAIESLIAGRQGGNFAGGLTPNYGLAQQLGPQNTRIVVDENLNQPGTAYDPNIGDINSRLENLYRYHWNGAANADSTTPQFYTPIIVEEPAAAPDQRFLDGLIRVAQQQQQQVYSAAPQQRDTRRPAGESPNFDDRLTQQQAQLGRLSRLSNTPVSLPDYSEYFGGPNVPPTPMVTNADATVGVAVGHPMDPYMNPNERNTSTAVAQPAPNREDLKEDQLYNLPTGAENLSGCTSDTASTSVVRCCESPLPESIAKRLNSGTFESVVKPVRIQAFKFFMEQHVENVIKQHKERTNRLMQLEREMTKLPNLLQCQMRQLLNQKESRYLRLKRQKLNKGMFSIIAVIGIGAFGEVSLVKKDDTNALYAMKTLSKSDIIKRRQAAHVKAERDILSEADNEWVVKLFYSFQDRENLFFIMEYIPGGDMMTLLQKKMIFEEGLARFYIAELVCAIESVHRLGFIHRDIKPDNILIDQNGHIKLTDFGLCTGLRWTHESKYYTEDSKTPDHNKQDSFEVINKKDSDCKLLQYRHQKQRYKAHSVVGTPNYIAPEVLMKKGYNQLCDWWSVGVILYEMVVGRCPFMADTPSDTQYKIIHWQDYLDIPRDCMSIDCEDLINGLLCGQENRIGRNGGAVEIKEHSFFQARFGQGDQGIDWEHLRQSPAPYRPIILQPTDVSNFDKFELPGTAKPATREDRTTVTAAEHAFYEFTFRRFFENEKPMTSSGSGGHHHTPKPQPPADHLETVSEDRRNSERFDRDDTSPVADGNNGELLHWQQQTAKGSNSSSSGSSRTLTAYGAVGPHPSSEPISTEAEIFRTQINTTATVRGVEEDDWNDHEDRHYRRPLATEKPKLPAGGKTHLQPISRIVNYSQSPPTRSVVVTQSSSVHNGANRNRSASPMIFNRSNHQSILNISTGGHSGGDENDDDEEQFTDARESEDSTPPGSINSRGRRSVSTVFVDQSVAHSTTRYVGVQRNFNSNHK